MKYHFKTLHEVLEAIINSNFNRNFTSILAMAFIYEEDDNILFVQENFNGLGFLFDFFNVGQFDLSNEEFKIIVNKLSEIDILQLDVLKIKVILYEKKIDELKVKFEKKYISNEVYKNQVNKYLD
ncbi:hypothetical protein [Flavobacterium sp.]|uniref:hypothetical protein n=1 Tax=Flavobacterium sp. TaxID=239 RepID=UPI003750EF4A